MKQSIRIAAIVLLIAQLFTISAAAGAEVPISVINEMITASSGTAVSSGVVNGQTADSGSEAASSGEAKSVTGLKDKSDFVPHPMQYGSAADVNIGGLEIHAGRWYTVVDGELTESEPWPDSYIYYSASQSKLTLHEIHYTITADKIGSDETFAALYLPKDMHIVLEGDNEILNHGYIRGSGVSNGVYAGNNRIVFEGNGVLTIDTRSGGEGYGIYAGGGIRIDGTFIGLSVFGASGAFSSAPQVAENRDMVVRRADLHPNYHGDVVVKDGSPYDKRVFTKSRYILFAIGRELSAEEQLRARIQGIYDQAVTDYDFAVEDGTREVLQGFEQGIDEFSREAAQGFEQELGSFYAGVDEWHSEISSIPTDWGTTGAHETYTDLESEIGLMLEDMLMNLGS